jgi:pilus assembly protein CpaE
MQQLKRQMRIITSQGLDEHPMTLVINGVSSEQQSQVSLKSAERAIGRKFDVVIPEDRRTMNAAINQGLTISAVRRGTKLEKAIAELCDRVAADALTEARAIR